MTKKPTKLHHLKRDLEINLTQRFLTTTNAQNILHSVNARDFLPGLHIFPSVNMPIYLSDPSYSDRCIDILFMKLMIS